MVTVILRIVQEVFLIVIFWDIVLPKLLVLFVCVCVEVLLRMISDLCDIWDYSCSRWVAVGVGCFSLAGGKGNPYSELVVWRTMCMLMHLTWRRKYSSDSLCSLIFFIWGMSILLFQSMFFLGWPGHYQARVRLGIATEWIYWRLCGNREEMVFPNLLKILK
jgi:hypothetical protein